MAVYNNVGESRNQNAENLIPGKGEHQIQKNSTYQVDRGKNELVKMHILTKERQVNYDADCSCRGVNYSVIFFFIMIGKLRYK